MQQYNKNIFNAEEIIEERIENGITKYLVKWTGWSIRHTTWEPLENLLDSRLMKNFRQKQKAQKGITEVQGVQQEQRSLGIEFTADRVESVDIFHKESLEVPKYPTLVPKEIIGQHKFWQQHSISELFNLTYIGKLTVDKLKSLVDERHDLVDSHYNNYVKNKKHIQRLAAMDTFSLPRITKTCPYKCASCERNYLNKETLKNHLLSHVKNIKLYKRKKYATDRDYLAVKQIKDLNLQAVTMDMDGTSDEETRHSSIDSSSRGSQSGDADSIIPDTVNNNGNRE